MLGYAKNLMWITSATCFFQKEPHGKGAQGGSRVSKAVRHTVPRVADAQSGSQRDAVGYAASRLSGLLVAFYSANQKALKRETYDSSRASTKSVMIRHSLM